MQPSSLSKASGSATAQVNTPISELIRDFNGLINSTTELETNTPPEQSSLPRTQSKPEQRLPSDKALDQLKIQSKKGAVTTGKLDSLFAGKSEEIKKQEVEAVIKFKAALSQNIPIQKELSELSIQQLNVLLPYTYVEASHPLNPVIAYNTPDGCYRRESILDDNVNMLQAYSVFLYDLNILLASTKNEETKIQSLVKSIKTVLSILLFGDNSNSKYMDEEYNAEFTFPTDSIHQGKELYQYILGLSKTAHLEYVRCPIDTLEENIYLSFKNEGRINILSRVPPEAKEHIITLLSKNLLLAYEQNDLSRIFKLTSDFMYCHVLYNANARTSQVIRDCFSLMLNEAPMPALTSVSHYMYLATDVDKEHMTFMQSLFRKRLTAIKEEDIDELTGVNIINRLIKKYEDNPAALADAEHYKCLTSSRVNGK